MRITGSQLLLLVVLLAGCGEPEPIVLVPLPPGLTYPWETVATVPDGVVARVAIARASSLVGSASTACAQLSRELAEGIEEDRARMARLRIEEVVPADELPQSLRGRRVDVNHASPSELQRLPRVGPATAARIIEARPFTSIDDLLRVRGIGPSTLEGIAPEVYIGSVAPEGSGAGSRVLVFDEIGVIEPVGVGDVEPLDQLGEQDVGALR